MNTGNKFIGRLLLIILAVSFSYFFMLNPLNARDKDFELWNQLGIKKNFNKSLGIEVSVNYRLYQNASTMRSFFPEIRLLYKINKYVRLNADFRIGMLHQGNHSYLWRSRYNLGLRLRKKLKPFVLKYKAEYQYGLNNYLWSEMLSTIPGNSYIRNKISVDYKLNKKWTPFISSEFFYNLDRRITSFTAYRAKLGVDYNFNKKNKISCAYLFEKEINVNKPKSRYILSLEYAYKF